MIKPFKFLRSPLLRTHDGHDLYPGEYFYSMNKEDIVTDRKVTPKYSIVQRCIHPIYKDVFKPDHDLLWYFSSKSSAEWLRDIWMRQDGGEVFHRTSDITISFQGQS
jgi:hypothetical protein